MNYQPSTKTLHVFCDGGSRGNPGPAACAFIVKDLQNKILHQQGFFLGITTNNQAEYQAVIEALKWLSTIHYQLSTINFFLDSQLVVNQITGTYKIKNQDLKIKNLEIKTLIKNCSRSATKLMFKIVNFEHVPRSQNFLADKLVNKTLDNVL